ncbi:kinase [Alteraurantiacibacter aestuarii]|uniref:kinase n=1 Tax=Alteraurantiacibacter aestuarii TaxID=650004 RepID=UPI0031D2D88C
MSGSEIEKLILSEGLPRSYLTVVDQYWQPLADEIASRATADGPLIVGVNGAQGSGKSTLCGFLEVLLTRRDVRAATLSIDDLYLTRSEREALGRELHPLFRTRGVPGTHAPGLGMAIIDKVRAGQSIDMPVFDKSIDDRSAAVKHVEGPLDVLLIEGWCVGARPQADEELLDPVNDLEADEDPEGIWRAVSNLWLRGEYADFFSQLDMLVMLKVENFEAVLTNRRLQEKKLAAKNPDGPHLMDEQALERFCQHYERLTRHMLEDLPRRADFVFEIDSKQVPKSLPAGLAMPG